MARLRKPLLVALVGAVWFAGVYPVGSIGDNPDLQVPLLAAWTLLAGAVAGTFWIVLAPWVAVAVLLAIDALNPCDDCRDELGLVGAAFLMSLAAIVADVLLALGVGARWGIGLLRARRPGSGGA